MNAKLQCRYSFSSFFIIYTLLLSLPPSLYSLSSLSPLISRRQVGGGDDSEAEMEQLESGELVCLSLTLSSPDRSFIPMPSSTHWSPLHFVDSRPSHPLSTTTVPSKLVLGRWIRGEPTMRAHEYITNGDQKKRFFSWKILRLRCNAARTHEEQRAWGIEDRNWCYVIFFFYLSTITFRRDSESSDFTILPKCNCSAVRFCKYYIDLKNRDPIFRTNDISKLL